MEITVRVNGCKFHKPGKCRNNKNWLENWFIQNLRKIDDSWGPFYCFAFKTKVI